MNPSSSKALQGWSLGVLAECPSSSPPGHTHHGDINHPTGGSYRWLQSQPNQYLLTKDRILRMCKKQPGFLPCSPWSIHFTELNLFQKGELLPAPKGRVQETPTLLFICPSTQRRVRKDLSFLTSSRPIKKCGKKILFFSKPAFHTKHQSSIFQGAKQYWWEFSWPFDFFFLFAAWLWHILKLINTSLSYRTNKILLESGSLTLSWDTWCISNYKMFIYSLFLTHHCSHRDFQES